MGGRLCGVVERGGVGGCGVVGGCQVMVNMDLNLIHKRNQPYCFLVAVNPTS